MKTSDRKKAARLLRVLVTHLQSAIDASIVKGEAEPAEEIDRAHVGQDRRDIAQAKRLIALMGDPDHHPVGRVAVTQPEPTTKERFPKVTADDDLWSRLEALGQCAFCEWVALGYEAGHIDRYVVMALGRGDHVGALTLGDLRKRVAATENETA